jgi:hypothetical protein
MDKSGVIGEISENLGGVVKQVVNQTIKTPLDLTKTAAGQVTGTDSPGLPSDLGQMEKAAGRPSTAVGSMQQKKPPMPQLSEEKKLEEKRKIEELRKQLHSMYYQGLTDPKKTPEEKVTEKLEREKQEEEKKLFDDNSKKPQPLPATVKQGTGEKLVGVSG